jgi:ribosomal protein S8
MLNDTLANALSLILNAEKIGRTECVIKPISKVIKKVFGIMKDNGYIGDFREINVVDAAATVCSVIENGVELGILIATQGGYSLLSQGEEHRQAVSLEEPVLF